MLDAIISFIAELIVDIFRGEWHHSDETEKGDKLWGCAKLIFFAVFIGVVVFIFAKWVF
ncbi:MAG: hypothetical protein KIH69_009035 [Anaerolineae bacterium]|nr:hypothetical protein [Anaerolineae bacterium]